MVQRNADVLLAHAIEAGMREPRELAVFMGQMQVESAGFSRLSENLNYSGPRLLKVFGTRNGINSIEEANALAARGPEAVANAMYGGEWGKERLGNTAPDDGWRFRGRGFVQITGRDNYERFGRALGIDLVNDPDQASTPDIAAAIAVQYWRERVANRGHQFDVTRATEIINGGRHGLPARKIAAQEWTERLQQRLPELVVGHVQAPAGNTMSMPGVDRRLGQGMPASDVRELQSLLDHLGYRDSHGRHLRIDGDFGRRTEEALKAFQSAHGLEPVGQVGPKTRAALQYADTHGPAPVDPAHPDHALHRQVSGAVDAMERSLGRTPDEVSTRLKAALLPVAKQAGLARVDNVVLSVATGDTPAGERVFVVQGRLDDPAHRRAHMATRQAVNTPVQASWEALERVSLQTLREARNSWVQADPSLQRAGTTPDRQPHANGAQLARHEHHDGPRRIFAP